MDPALPLAWMRTNGEVLRRLVVDEQGTADDRPPASDPSIRASLRFLAQALAATVPPDAAALDGLDSALVDRFARSRDLFDHHLETGRGAMALEAHLQWRTRPGVDPSLDVAQDRRLRLLGWMRLFVLTLEEELGAAHDGIAAQIIAQLDGRQRELGRLVITLDAQARAQARARQVALDATARDQLSQAVMVQAYTRHLAEAVCQALSRD